MHKNIDIQLFSLLIAVVWPSETPSVLSGINRIQRWSQSKPPYLAFIYFLRQYIVFSHEDRGAIRNKHPFGHEADFRPSQASAI